MHIQARALAVRSLRVGASAVAALAAVSVVGAALTLNAPRAEARTSPVVEPIAFKSPAPGHEVNSPFGLRRLPWEKHGRLHAGVDIAAPKGSPVVATTDGIVLEAGVSPSYGRFVKLAHGQGLTSIYAHLDATNGNVAAGAAIDEGEKIATVGSSGRSTGAHLHFELRKDGTPLDPARFMDRSFFPDDLPIAEAAKVSPIVRIAQVAGWGRKGRKS